MRKFTGETFFSNETLTVTVGSGGDPGKSYVGGGPATPGGNSEISGGSLS
jgi:hypothetical protein